MGKGKKSVAEMEPEETNESAEAPQNEPEAPVSEPEGAVGDPSEADASAPREPEVAESSPEAAGHEPDAAPEAAESEAPELPAELEITDDELVRLVGGILFASPDPIAPARIAKLLSPRRSFPVKRVEEALETLTERLGEAGLPVHVQRLAGGAQLLTDPELATEVARLFANRKVERMTPAGLETLAVVAYRQPVTKGEIEAIRGVQAGPVLRNLVDRNLIKVTGRADQPGSPLQYGTTREFLERFGLGSLSDLPRDPELLRE
jgi:segregation and condensation protein B